MIRLLAPRGLLTNTGITKNIVKSLGTALSGIMPRINHTSRGKSLNICESPRIASSHEKLARFLLDLSLDHGQGKGEVGLKLTLTHEEIAQMIGASRETVTRMVVDFKKRQLFQIKGLTLII